MRLAVLVGVSKYKNSQDDLPFCEQDLSVMQELLGYTGEYEDIFVLSGNNKPAVEVKSLLTEWIEKYQAQTVDEIFFYYTGHGLFNGDGFYFQLFDFESTRLKQTSLANSELDDWLRSLNPTLTVKVIDACNSGIPYIKGGLERGNEAIKKYFSNAANVFQKCVFMFSSTSEQYSWPDGQMSAFTKVFVEGVTKHQADTMRYRDIMDYISDEFESNPEFSGLQTPVFVTQAYNTELFCYLNPDIRQIKILEGESADKDTIKETPEAKVLGLKQIIELDAKQYVSREEVVEILTEISSRTNSYSFSPELTDLYDIECAELASTSGIAFRKDVGQWLVDNNHNYFAEPTYRTVYDNDPRAFIRPPGMERPSTQVLEGFDVTVELPFKGIRVFARRQYPNIPYYYLQITYLVSRTKLRFLYLYTDYVDKNWDEISLNPRTEWRAKEVALKDKNSIFNEILNILENFEEYILNQLKDRFDVQS